MIHRPTVTVGKQYVVCDVVVLAEGKDDAELVEHLLKQRIPDMPGIHDRVQVVNCRGVSNVPAQVVVVATSNRFRAVGGTLGIMTDDDTIDRALASIAPTLTEHAGVS